MQQRAVVAWAVLMPRAMHATHPWLGPLTASMIVAAALLAAGCAPAELPAMTARSGAAAPPKAPLAASPAAPSEIVFVRPESACDTADYPTVVDGMGRFVGNLAPGTTFTTRVAPGDHTFIAWPNLDLRSAKYPGFRPVGVLRVHAVAGERAIVVAEIPRGPRLYCPKRPWFVLRRRAPGDAEATAWIAAARPLDPDPRAGERHLEGKRELADAYFEMGRRELDRRATGRAPLTDGASAP